MGEINPYEVIKDTLKNILSMKIHMTILFILTLLYMFGRLFTKDFLILNNFAKSILPLGILQTLSKITIPILNFLFFIGSFGILVVLLVSIIFTINRKKGWFESIVHNYNFYFRGNNIGICDNIAEKLIAIPVNVGIIISFICYIFDSDYISNYINNYTVVLAAPVLVLYFYFLAIISLLFRKVDEEY